MQHWCDKSFVELSKFKMSPKGVAVGNRFPNPKTQWDAINNCHSPSPDTKNFFFQVIVVKALHIKSAAPWNGHTGTLKTQLI